MEDETKDIERERETVVKQNKTKLDHWTFTTKLKG